jgi:acetate---CoA ligase (ADP-forming)
MNYISFEKIFFPKSIVIIGATDRKGSVGRGLVENAFQGKKQRKVYLVNPNRKKVFGKKVYSSINDIKERIDLAVIAVPANVVLGTVKQCCQKWVGSIIIVSAGFAEIGEKGKELQEKIKRECAKKNIPFIGPNCLGIIRPSIVLNASFAPLVPKSGGITLISQSGALIDSIIALSKEKNYGFANVISYGNEAGITLPDFLNWAGQDKETKVIALYLEGLKDGREFLKIAQRITQEKPIVVLKGGKTEITRKAVSSHTGALAGQSKVYSAAFKQSGIIEVNSVQELLDVSKALSWQPKCKNGIGIITNGGGAGILCTDYCGQAGINLPGMSREVVKKLEKSKIMHQGFSKSNPLDIIGDALSERYQLAIGAMLSQKNIYGLIVIQTLQIMTEPEKNAKIIVKIKQKHKEKPIISIFMGGSLDGKAHQILEQNQIPNYPDPLRAVKAMRALVR